MLQHLLIINLELYIVSVLSHSKQSAGTANLHFFSLPAAGRKWFSQLFMWKTGKDILKSISTHNNDMGTSAQFSRWRCGNYLPLVSSRMFPQFASLLFSARVSWETPIQGPACLDLFEVTKFISISTLFWHTFRDNKENALHLLLSNKSCYWTGASLVKSVDFYV